MNDRYGHLVAHADTGIGADEYRGPARFTRATEKTVPPASTAKHQTEGNEPTAMKEQIR
ncbi:hypothetical protein GII30_21245 [Gordonia amarae]|uniref:Uncharacterized protein n=2 Tax=Gordonia amarae TaxID=36821 RepID=G7GWA4_9ACTN|nr:hypothetical protein [Gordonia amarae]MCS3880973.1 hypothetical protein [Gordonia amarae]QHN19214.1 hypothetical protein GII35_21540 [Gordonia amarae]QHN23690.1 hypothetical protein GII34_21040 [Gordonia amarae]QHN32602.1 hypothetical protein GII32_21370 [Gordonia amarae]QHN41350.1 hypothetical protein GII30_21245 [Gordonia amarae]